MPIQVDCACGKSFKVADAMSGKRGKCPGCGGIVTVPMPEQQVEYSEEPYSIDAPPIDDAPADYAPPAIAPALPGPPLQYAGGATRTPGGAIAPPPAYGIHLPTMVREKLRQPGLPPCRLFFNTQGADVNAKFDVGPAFQSFADSFAKVLKKKYNVELGPPAPGALSATVRVIRMDEGNRWMRYLLGIFAGGTVFEVDGQVLTAAGQPVPFRFKNVGRMGLLGGDSLGLLKVNGTVLGRKVGKAALKAQRA